MKKTPSRFSLCHFRQNSLLKRLQPIMAKSRQFIRAVSCDPTSSDLKHVLPRGTFEMIPIDVRLLSKTSPLKWDLSTKRANLSFQNYLRSADRSQTTQAAQKTKVASAQESSLTTMLTALPDNDKYFTLNHPIIEDICKSEINSS